MYIFTVIESNMTLLCDHEYAPLIFMHSLKNQYLANKIESWPKVDNTVLTSKNKGCKRNRAEKCTNKKICIEMGFSAYRYSCRRGVYFVDSTSRQSRKGIKKIKT